MLDLKVYFEFMDQVGARYGIAPEDIIVQPGLEVPGKTADGKLFFAEMIDPQKALAWIRNEQIDWELLHPKKLIECLMLHEIYHLKNHFRNVNELTWEERGANDIEADEWVLKEMGLL